MRSADLSPAAKDKIYGSNIEVQLIENDQRQDVQLLTNC